MICFPNAKINLGLHITEKRNDGYHNIETCFYPIPLRDALEIVPAADFSFIQTGLELSTSPNDNLIIKALNLFREYFEVPPLSIYLKKVIPSGAGLGGGSSDAAFMLKLLHAYTSENQQNDNTPLPPSFESYYQKLEQIAHKLGADCPFFLHNTPTIASGIGNIFDSIDLSLKGYTICIIKPNLSISTKDAYASITPAKPAIPLREILQNPVKEWKNKLTNDFEPIICQQYPIISEIKSYMYASNAIYAAMSGSGSAIFGLFEKDITLTFPDCFIWKAKL